MRYLALDIGNVCCTINPANGFAALRLAPSPELLATGRAFECGAFSEEEFLARCHTLMPGRSETAEELKAAFNSILIAPMPGMRAWVHGLAAQGVQPVFFSDISCTHLARFRELFPEAAALPGIYSYEAGAMKPSDAMFEAFEARYGKPCLYTDDRQELIDAARKRGWRAEMFRSADELNQLLQLC